MHELVARSSAWQVRAAKDKMKVGGFALSAISYYHASEHSARKSRADSCTHCLHARIKGLAGVGRVCALTGLNHIFCFFLLAMLWALSCRGRRYPVSATPTHTLRVCVNSLDDPRGRGEHCSPAKNHKVTFLLSRFLVTKSAAKVSKEDSRRPPSEPRAACTS